MTKGYIIEQILKTTGMIKEHQNNLYRNSIKHLGKDIKAIARSGIKRNTELTEAIDLVIYKYNKHRKFESAKKEVLLTILEEIVKIGFENNVKGFDSNFSY